MAEDLGKAQNATLDAWLKRKKKGASSFNGIQPLKEGDPPVVSHGQERLWLLEQLYPDQNLYHYAHRYRLTGDVNIDAFTESFQVLAKAHDILLSNYQSTDVGVLQKVKQEEIPVTHFDFSNLKSEEQTNVKQKKTKELSRIPFDLEKDPLIRLYVFKLTEKTFEVLVVLHHIIGDAWSMGIINRELSKFYEQHIANGVPAQNTSSIAYKDFASWQRKKEVKKSDLEYWKEKLSGDLPVFSLPKNKETTSVFQGNTFNKTLNGELNIKLHELATKCNTTMYVLMLAAYKLLVSRYAKNQDVIVGSPFSNRDTPDLEKLIGFFNETLVLRSQIDESLSFTALVDQLKQTTIEALSHKNVPFDLLVNELGAERLVGETPLFQTMFLYNSPAISLDLGKGIAIEEEMLDLGVSKFDLTLFVNEGTDKSLKLAFEYNQQIEEWIIAQMATHFENLLQELVNSPEAPLKQHSLYSAEMRKTFSNNWYGQKTKVTEYESIHELIRHQIERNGNADAATFEDSSISYERLDTWADQIAYKLKIAGLENNEFVGLYTPRSLEMVAGILGILRAGFAYLPLDPGYPQQRLDFMLQDSAASVVLFHPNIQTDFRSGNQKLISLAFDPNNEPQPNIEVRNELDDFAYIIYTSGSTGKPKGVPVTHQNLLHSTTARFNFFEDEMQRFLLLSSFSFDSSIVGIFWALCSGGTLVLPPNRIEQDIEGLCKIILSNKVSHTLMLPSLYQVLLNYAQTDELTSLKAVIVAGEACPTSLKQTHFEKLPETKLYNEYGPTEASVWCIAHEITPEDEIIPIGKPIQNSAAYILDSQLNLVPAGINGELYIGGRGVTKGYLNRPELTKERFLPDHISRNGQLYKTGDLARFGQDGKIYFLGRADSQVKIRGFRVEPEEIRNKILLQPSVSEAIVKVVEDDSSHKQLVAWVQSDDPEISSHLYKKLKESLPAYMVPSQIDVVATLPKLPNGKININKLVLRKKDPLRHNTILSPNNKNEALMLNIWKDILNLEQISTEDNFFDLGGDSILSIQIVGRARKEGLKIGPIDIFKYQTIKELARMVKLDDKFDQGAHTSGKDYPIRFSLSYQQKAFLLHHLQAQHDEGFLQLEFGMSGPVDELLMKKAWQKITQIHHVLRTSIHWEGVESPYQVIHQTSEISWNFLDLNGKKAEEQKHEISDFKANDKAKGLDLTQVGSGRFTLIKVADKRFLLCWSSHHILIDGWSAAIVFKDALKIYQDFKNGVAPTLARTLDYKDFLDWKSESDTNAQREFWKELLQGKPAPLFSDFKTGRNNISQSKDLNKNISPKVVEALTLKAKEERVTISTLLQGTWLLTLRSYFNKQEVSTGLTVTGRSVELSGIDQLAGLLMNVLPFKTKISGITSLSDWFGEIQSKLNELKNYEHTNPDQIQVQRSSENHLLFDNLFVFGNFMGQRLQIGEVEIDAFKGDFSATYPLTIRVNPSSNFEINCRYNPAIVSTDTATWLIESYVALNKRLATLDLSTSTVQSIIPVHPSHLLSKSIETTESNKEIDSKFSGTQNSIQLSLLKIWENILDTQLIGIHDNYFDLGGDSLGAIQLFSKIEAHLGKKLSPTVLINHPTIAKLASLLDQESSKEKWSSIIPMKTSGNQPPLFCLHSGGAHVLFYQGLAKHITTERPVYAIQPAGIDGQEEKHESIAEMATHYISEMKKVQAQGPYHLIGTCFGNAVGIEMAHQLKAMNDDLAVLIVVDSAPAYLVPPSPNGERKPVSRMMAMVKQGNWRGIYKKFKNRYLRLNKKLTANTRTEQEKELDEIVESLNDVYVNYNWKPIDSPVVFVRSSEFSARKDKKFHLERWKTLAQGSLKVSNIEGTHLTLFDEPEVKGLVKQIERHLSEDIRA
ncbi:amino acid adenylation domain-containing protein [Roseivirga sp.]|uniref:amino acid adenylation domain-containing protein n=1 Tax=Roseivirga sp. TaxID=1964215 RepID=UPI003B8CF575